MKYDHTIFNPSSAGLFYEHLFLSEHTLMLRELMMHELLLQIADCF